MGVIEKRAGGGGGLKRLDRCALAVDYVVHLLAAAVWHFGPL